MKLKKIMMVFMLVLICGMGLTACGSSDAENVSSSDSSSEEASTASSSVSGYSFTSGDTVIIMGSEADPIVESLGDPKNYFESESCAFEGLDKVYTYSGFKLNTYPEDDVDYVLSVVFSDDTVETDEGITIGSSKDDVLAAYGEPDEEKASSYIYENNGTRLSIGISGDTVSTVEISAITD